MSPVKLAHLRFYCAVVEEGTIAAAARRLHCVPSNITARLKELESLLGHELFVREKSRLGPTPSGRLFYDEAKTILSRTDGLSTFFSSPRPKGLLKIASLDVALFSYLPAQLPGFIRAFPEIDLKILCRPTFAIERMLHDKEVDLAITDGPVVHPALETRSAFFEPLYLVAPSGISDIDALLRSGTTLFLYDVDCFYRVHFENWLRGRGVEGARVVTCESYDAILRCVAEGLGISCFPGSVVDRTPPPSDVSFIKVPDLTGSDVYFVWRAGSADEVLNAFLDRMPDCGVLKA